MQIWKRPVLAFLMAMLLALGTVGTAIAMAEETEETSDVKIHQEEMYLADGSSEVESTEAYAETEQNINSAQTETQIEQNTKVQSQDADENPETGSSVTYTNNPATATASTQAQVEPQVPAEPQVQSEIQAQTETHAQTETQAQTEMAQAKTGELYITKYVLDDKDNNLYRLEPGVTYTFRRSGIAEDAPAQAVTNEDGYVSIKLQEGTYEVEESGVDEEAKADSFEVTIKEDQPIYLQIVDQEVQANHLIKVVDAVTGDALPKATIEFYRDDLKITFVDPEEKEVISSLTSDKNGYIHLPESANYNGYSYQEGMIGYRVIAAPAGFAVSADITYVGVQKSDIKDGQCLLEIPVNYAKGSIEISVKDVQSEAQLPGVVYTITALEDILAIDGSIAYPAGSVVQEIITADTGIAKVDNLPEGSYGVMQKQYVNGYIYSREQTTVRITKEEKSLRLSYALTPTTITINVTNNVLPINVANIQFAYSLNGQMAAYAATNGNGQVVLKNLSPGTYTLWQDSDVADTVKDTNVYTYIVDENGYISGKTAEYLNITLKAAEQQTVITPNKKLTVSIVDSVDNSILVGCGFEVVDARGQIIKNGVMQNGPIEISDLNDGDYIVRQTVSKKGYLINTAEYSVSLISDCSVTIKDERVYGYVELNKLTSTKMEGIAGTKYLIKDINGQELEVVETNSQGIARTQSYLIGTYANGEMQPTTYTIEEQTPANGYEEDKQVYRVTFDYLDNKTPLVYVRIKIPGFAKSSATGYTVATNTAGTTAAANTSNVAGTTAANPSSSGNIDSVTPVKTGLVNKAPYLFGACAFFLICGSSFLVHYRLRKKRKQGD